MSCVASPMALINMIATAAGGVFLAEPLVFFFLFFFLHTPQREQHVLPINTVCYVVLERGLKLRKCHHKEIKDTCHVWSENEVKN